MQYIIYHDYATEGGHVEMEQVFTFTRGGVVEYCAIENATPENAMMKEKSEVS